MLKQRKVLRTAGTALIGLAALISSSEASPRLSQQLGYIKQSDLKKELEKIREDSIYTRESTIFSYEEYKSLRQVPDQPKNDKDLKTLVESQIKLRPKLVSIIKNPKKAYELLTEKEKTYYKLELHLLDPEDAPIDCMLINQRYNLKFTAEQFKRSEGAKILWFLDRHYGYRYSDEKTKKK